MCKVLHCITTIERGGAEKQLLILAKQQIEAGMDVSIAFLKGDPHLKCEFTEFGVKVIEILHNKNLIKQIIQLRKITNSRDMILHAHLPRAEIISIFSSKRSKLVITRHNSEKFYPSAPRLISSFLSRIVLKKASACIAISKSVKLFMLEKNEVPKSKTIEVIYYGYSDEIIVHAPTGESDKYIVGTVGRLTKQKNQSLLLKSFALFSKNKSNVSLIVIGKGELRDNLKKLSVNLEISQNVTWIEKTQNIYKSLSELNLFVFPSTYEGFGLILLECMQVGVPILGANNSAIPEVLGIDYPGLFDDSDPKFLASMIEDFQFYDFNFESYYQSSLELFNPEKMCQKIKLVYQNLPK
jgi:glycosyltransferase involved in cell wall biosynthesis